MDLSSHAPPDYRCPCCAIVAGEERPDIATTQSEVLARTDWVTAFVSSHQWPNNAGHVLVVPNEHIENLYTLPGELAAPLHEMTRRIALALKTAFECTGTSPRQHNEPHGGQDVWHYHIHVFPRYENDGLYGSRRTKVPIDERLTQAKTIRRCL